MSQVRLIPDPIPNFPAIAYKGTPVLTTEMLAHAYGVNAKQIRQNFNNNRERFTEGKHFYMLSGNELREFRLCVEIIDAQISTKVRTLTLWTDRGAARHAKMLESDKAWDVYEMLEDTFFCVDKLAAEERARLAENVKSIPQTTTPSTAEDRAPLRALVHAWAKITNVHHAALWPQVKAHFQLSRIDDLPAEWLPDALAFVQGKIDGEQKALPQAEQAALPCTPPALTPAEYLKGKRIFNLMNKLMTDFDLVKTHVQLWGRPGARLARLSPEQESLYQNAVDASKMALCSLNQAQYALRIAMQIQSTHSFDGR